MPEGGDIRVSEKLDVFALGVLGVEMLQKFGTRMERADALTRLRRGEFPDRFTENVGSSVRDTLHDMVRADEDKRPTCAEVQMRIRGYLQHSISRCHE